MPSDTDEYEKRAKGGPLMTAITPVKLHPDQPYMYIDLNVPIRAVYFPLAQKASSVFPDLCSYLMVDFRMRQGVRMYDTVNSIRPETALDKSANKFAERILQERGQTTRPRGPDEKRRWSICKASKNKNGSRTRTAAWGEK